MKYLIFALFLSSLISCKPVCSCFFGTSTKKITGKYVSVEDETDSLVLYDNGVYIHSNSRKKVTSTNKWFIANKSDCELLFIDFDLYDKSSLEIFRDSFSKRRTYWYCDDFIYLDIVDMTSSYGFRKVAKG